MTQTTSGPKRLELAGIPVTERHAGRGAGRTVLEEARMESAMATNPAEKDAGFGWTLCWERLADG